MARRKCDVCKLYRGDKPHTGAMHDAIRRNRERVRKGLMGRPAKIRRRIHR